MKRRVWILVLAGVALGCTTSAAPVASRYFLRADVTPSGVAPADARVGLGRVEVAPYLEAPGLAIETAPGQIQWAANHEWAEPLQAGLALYLRSALSQAAGAEVGLDAGGPSVTHAVDVFIEALHGTMEGEAVLVASYGIRRPDRGVVSFRFSQRSPLPRPGYPAMVEAEKALLRELARAIATSLRAAGVEAD